MTARKVWPIWLDQHPTGKVMKILFERMETSAISSFGMLTSLYKSGIFLFNQIKSFHKSALILAAVCCLPRLKHTHLPEALWRDFNPKKIDPEFKASLDFTYILYEVLQYSVLYALSGSFELESDSLPSSPVWSHHWGSGTAFSPAAPESRNTTKWDAKLASNDEKEIN